MLYRSKENEVKQAELEYHDLVNKVNQEKEEKNVTKMKVK